MEVRALLSCFEYVAIGKRASPQKDFVEEGCEPTNALTWGTPVVASGRRIEASKNVSIEQSPHVTTSSRAANISCRTQVLRAMRWSITSAVPSSCPEIWHIPALPSSNQRRRRSEVLQAQAMQALFSPFQRWSSSAEFACSFPECLLDECIVRLPRRV